jgi:hypothetical protein
MSVIKIRRHDQPQPDGTTVAHYIVPALALQVGGGKRLIPNPNGQESCAFPSLEAAEDAVRRAGFDAEYEGRTLRHNPYAPPPAAPATDPFACLQDAGPILLKRLQDREPSVIANAAFSLGRLSVSAAIDPLIGVLGHDDANVRKQATDALVRLGEATVPALRRAYDKVRGLPDNRSALIRLSIMSTWLEMARQNRRDWLIPVLPLIMEALQDEHWLVRGQAVLLVGNLIEPEEWSTPLGG